MGRKVKACAKCTQNCLLVHGKKTNSSPFTPSFFKVMIGDRYSEVLFVPPEFAPVVSALIGQIALLEDSSGQQWEVTVSKLNGSLVFQQGWNAFALHHRLQIGDFVVFDYIMGSQFLVKIYGKTGCMKLDFSENRSQRKRSRTTGNSTFKDGPCYTIDIGSMNKQGSNTSVISGSDVQISQSHCEVNDLERAINKITSNCENDNGRLRVSKSEYLEEPYYIIDRDLGDIQGEDRCPLFDLSYFEMLENTSDRNKSNKITVGGERHLHYDASLRSQIEDVPVKKDSVHEKAVNRVVASGASDFEMMEKNNDFQKMDKRLTVSEKIPCKSKISENILFANAAETQKNRGNRFNSSNRPFKIHDITKEESKAQSKSRSEIYKAMVSQKKHTSLADNNQTDRLKLTGKFRESNVLFANPMLNSQLGGRMNLMKKEAVEMSPEACSDEEMIQGKLPQVTKVDCGQSSDAIVRENAIQLVKSETLSLAPISSPIATNISCEIASASEHFLELPTRMPTSSFRQRFKRGRMVVLLRDPHMRIWPVLYHETSEFKILTSGWEAFSKVNNIQPGDECVFGVENEDEGIYRVNIVRK